MIVLPTEELLSEDQDVNLVLYGATDVVFRINDDPYWHRARPLLNYLCRRYGKFQIEVTK